MNRSRVTADLASHGNIFVDIANDRVGIGSTIPTHKIDVSGTVKLHDHTGYQNHITYKSSGPAPHLHFPTGPLANLARTPYLGFGDRGDASGDFKIYHDHYNAHLKLNASFGGGYGAGLGGLFISNHSTSGVIGIQGANGSGAAQNSIYIPAGATAGVKIYQAGQLRFETVGYGVTVHGTTETQELNVTGVSTFNGNITGTGSLSITSAAPEIFLTDTNANSDYSIVVNGGQFRVRDETNSANRLAVNSDGHVDIYGRLDAIGGFVASSNSSIEGNLELTSTYPSLTWTDTNHNSDYRITNNDGQLIIYDITNGAHRLNVNADGHIDILGHLDVGSGIDVTGQLNVTGNIRIGSNEKYRLYDNSGTNRFDTYNQTIQFVNKGDDGSISPTIAKFIPYGAVELYYGTGGAASVKVFETSATGVILSSTNAGSSAEPELVLYRNSASPADADYLGQIKFNGKSDTGTQRTYAKITGKILDASNGTEDGIIEFAHIKAGSQVITGRFRSDSLQLLNSTNFSVAGTSEFTGAATFNGSVNSNAALNIGAGSDIRLTTGNWTGNAYAKIQHHSNRLYLAGGSNTNPSIVLRYDGSDQIYMKSNGTFYPVTDSSSNLGESNYRWANVYADTLHGNGANVTNVNATTLDSIDSGSFLRSDAADSFNSTLTWSGSAGGTSIDSAAADGYASFRVMRNNNSSGSFADGMYIGYANNNSGVTRIYGGGATSGALTVHGSGDVRINGFTAWHSGNDGSGSGLDADLLDGIQSTAFIRTSGSSIVVAADGNNYPRITHNQGSAQLGLFRGTNSIGGMYIGADVNSFRIWTDNFTARLTLTQAGSVSTTVQGTLWGASNDGSGSGLDADTLDGVQGANYVRTNNGNQSIAGNLSVGSGTSSNIYMIDSDNGNRTIHCNSDRIGFLSSTGAWSAFSTDAGLWVAALGLEVNSATGNASNITMKDADHGDRIIHCNSNYIGFLTASGAWGSRCDDNGNWEILGNTAWHAGNDGSGSGLDADTLDGTHGGHMIRSGAQTAVTNWHIAAYRNGQGTSPHFYFSHSGGYGMHINTYNTTSSIYALELHNNSKQLMVVYNNGECRHGGTTYPASNNSYDLGTSSLRWRNIYSQQLNVTKASGNLSGTFVASNGLGTLEIGGSTGAFIDLKQPSSDDFDFRLGTSGSGGYMNVPSGQSISVTGNINPAANNTYDLGTTSLRWRNIYTNDLNLSNEGGANDVDGTWGNFTIQEGEDDLFLINKRNGKKYKFNLTEVS